MRALNIYNLTDLFLNLRKYKCNNSFYVTFTLTFVIDLFGSDDLVDDGLEEVVLARHPGWKTGDVQLPVANGVIQR